MTEKEKVYQALDALKIDYQVIDHPAVYTIDEMEQLDLMQHGEVCKNLFLKDSNGKRHFLIVLEKDKKADLSALKEKLGTSRLGFASESRLMRYLKLEKGAVTPLALINDVSKSVEVVLDASIVGKSNLGFHPNDNTSTVFMTFDGLMTYLSTYTDRICTLEI